MELKAGDIVKNLYADPQDQLRYMMYLRDSSFRGDDICDCVTCGLKVVKIYKHKDGKDTIEVAGHLGEFDALLDAIKRL